jgi:hypothetical protein
MVESNASLRVRRMTGDTRFTKSAFTDEVGAEAYLRECMPHGHSPSLRTLRRWRRIGIGPAWKKEGRFVWYYRNDLDEWLLLVGRKPRDRRHAGVTFHSV